MKSYSTGTWGIGFVFSISGSVFPKSLVWALPDALAAVAVSYATRDEDVGKFLQLDEEDVSRCISLMGGYYALMGFILVFRSQLAYSRWWEGGALLQQLRGEWFNAYSSLLAFCSSKESDRHQVETFQHLLMRLMSILYCSALEQVADLKDKQFEIFDIDGLDENSLRFLNTANDKCEVTLQWIQRLIVEASNNGTIPIPPPILSRVFQEFSRGIVNLNHVRKIAEFPFPFPWPQMITLMLVAEWFITPIMCGSALSSPFWAFMTTFFVTFAFWNIHYIAQELENPFGDDDNDLPLREMQVDMNRSLSNLLESRAQVPPHFEYSGSDKRIIVCSSVLQELGHLGPVPVQPLKTTPRRLGGNSSTLGKRYTSPMHTRQTWRAFQSNKSFTQPNLDWLMSRGSTESANLDAQGFTASAPIFGLPGRFASSNSATGSTPLSPQARRQLQRQRSLRVGAAAIEDLGLKPLDRSPTPTRSPEASTQTARPASPSFGMSAKKMSLHVESDASNTAEESVADAVEVDGHPCRFGSVEILSDDLGKDRLRIQAATQEAEPAQRGEEAKPTSPSAQGKQPRMDLETPPPAGDPAVLSVTASNGSEGSQDRISRSSRSFTLSPGKFNGWSPEADMQAQQLNVPIDDGELESAERPPRDASGTNGRGKRSSGVSIDHQSTSHRESFVSSQLAPLEEALGMQSASIEEPPPAAPPDDGLDDYV
mmetsp:Transcript_23647/g.55130  ORF Transcript_23647/g.55130 Transcript_23647/m.55130 type:complete len:711 (+) Transcript_23647:142-2274(+)|eukprot:CAMPEP_0178453262 /NCGR_PEP_ID=MMETSP0689_2-20121128/44716_1 /TAXON_ID=160604 /ORGANISM="Amphidinium massartii, Strain CS-259" /LENGTH=710 /DNA_ID=CAMNT_0020079087 /DNA_START=47 /DNA_END=2179 /DNA_ORIENTATION=+